MPNDNWDDLLQSLGAKPSEKPAKSPASAAPPRADEPEPADEESALAIESAEAAAVDRPGFRLPDQYPTAKPSAWDSLAVTLGVADDAGTGGDAPNATPKPETRREPKPTPAAKRPSTPEPIEGELEEIEGLAPPPAADEAIAEIVAEAPATKSESARPQPTPSEETAGKSRGFTGWFPFAARRAKPEPAEPVADAGPATESAGPKRPERGAPSADAQLPRDLFAAPEASLDDGEAPGEKVAEENGDDQQERPKRRRRRGGRRRRRRSDEDADAPRADSLEDELSEDSSDEDRSDDAPLRSRTEEGEASEDADFDSEESGDRPPRRRRRRRRGRGASRDEAAASARDDEQLSAGEDPHGDEELDDEDDAIKSAPSHKNITPWRDAIALVVDANIAARAERRAVSGGRGGPGRGGSGRGGRSRGGRRRRGSGAGSSPS